MDNLPDVSDEPLEYRPRTVSFPQISEEMVASIALGMEDELVVASRHGFSVEKYAELCSQPWFQNQIAAKRAELEKNGVTARVKAAWMGGELLEKLYLMAADNNASFSQVAEAAKIMVKVGGLEPKDEKKEAGGPSFQINIDLGAQSVSLTNTPTIQPVVIDTETKEISQ